MEIFIWIQTQDSVKYLNPHTAGDVMQIETSGFTWGKTVTNSPFKVIKTGVLPQTLVDALLYEPLYPIKLQTRRKFRVDITKFNMASVVVTVPINQFMGAIIQTY